MAESIQQQNRPATLRRWVARVSPGLKFRGFLVLSRLAGLAPLRFSYFISILVGDFIYFFWQTHSANAVGNMRRVLGPGAGERAVRRAARNSFRNYVKTLADFIRFPYVTSAEIDRRIQQQYGLEVVATALAQGKGVLALSGHLGNWDFAGAFMGRHGYPLYALADRFEPPQLDEMVIQTRRNNGVTVIKMEAMAMRTIFEALKRNEIVLLLIDRPMPGEGVPVQFFGETAWLPSGPAAIALKTGAPIIMGSCIRLPGDIEFTGGIEPILEYQHLVIGNKQADIVAITQCIASAMESLIRRAPDQWYMFRPMWPRPETPRERRRAARQARRAARAATRYSFRHSISRLQARLRRRRHPAPELSGTAIGISVDPPEVEQWVRSTGAEET